MTFPEWADKRLSNDLSVLRAKGEGQNLEYMREFPTQAQDLGKEIAAFATSNAGIILIGVSDAGDLVGLPEIQTSADRDNMIQRLEGITNGTVKPAITPTAHYAVESSQTVLVVTVPKGSQPVYYSRYRPYLRHLTASRPAEPHEVVELVEAWLSKQTIESSEGDEDVSEFYTEVASALITILIYGAEVEERSLNPWLEIWRAEFRALTSEFRALASGDIARSENVSEDLRNIADCLDNFANLRMRMGMGSELQRLADEACEAASSFMLQYVDNIPLSESSRHAVRTAIVEISRQLGEFTTRLDQLAAAGRMEELQDEASSLGSRLSRLTYYNIDFLGDSVRSDLREVSRRLHLTDTIRLYMDGGASVQRVIDQVTECEEEIRRIVDMLE